ncbi:hypothetical protein MQC76_27960, partial [Escherichia coli]|nr:hypothetical protein [Escherichia coli]
MSTAQQNRLISTNRIGTAILHFRFTIPTFPVFIVEGRYVSKNQNSQNDSQPGAGQIPENRFR